MKKTGLVIFTCLSILILKAQNPVAQQYAALISGKELKENLEIIASDAMEGRETGKRGQKMAAAFINASFEELGLMPPINGSYYQPLELYAPAPGETYIKAGGKVFRNFEEIAYYGSANSGAEITVPLVFAGKGRPEDCKNLDLRGKAVLILQGIDESNSAVDFVRDLGATMIFTISPVKEDFNESVTLVKNSFSRGRLSLNQPEFTSSPAGTFILSHAAAENILNTTMEKIIKAADASNKKALKKIKTGLVVYKTSMSVKTVKTENVLGFLEGSDKKNELLVITAHYDHIGKRKSGDGDLINNGADDDGSGTVAVMQLAKVFAKAKQDGKGPRRSILFMTVTGEEKGLFGSEYYTRNPVYPLDNTIVNLNIDMIGRRDAQHKDSAPYVYVIGADKLSHELNKVSENVNNQYTKLIFDYTYNDESHPDRLYYRSDHWNFAQKNIPIIFYFDGIHEDYHRPSDEVEKIEFDLLTTRTQCVFYTAWEIANREERIMPDVKKN